MLVESSTCDKWQLGNLFAVDKNLNARLIVKQNFALHHVGTAKWVVECLWAVVVSRFATHKNHATHFVEWHKAFHRESSRGAL